MNLKSIEIPNPPDSREANAAWLAFLKERTQDVPPSKWPQAAKEAWKEFVASRTM